MIVEPMLLDTNISPIDVERNIYFGQTNEVIYAPEERVSSAVRFQRRLLHVWFSRPRRSLPAIMKSYREMTDKC